MELAVTWIAPEIKSLPGLAWLTELGKIQKIPNVKVLTLTGPDITREDVAQTLLKPCGIMIWSGHGNPEGLLLPDNTLIKAKWLALQLERGARPRATILAACGSQVKDDNIRSMTEAVCRVGLNVIGFPAEASDRAAAAFTIEFIRALSVQASVVSAFDVAMEEVASTETARGIFLMPGIADSPIDLGRELSGLKGIVLATQADIRAMMERLGVSAYNPNPTRVPQEIIKDAQDGGSGSIGVLRKGGVTRSGRVASGHINALGKDGMECSSRGYACTVGTMK